MAQSMEMVNEEQENICSKLLQKLKVQNKADVKFEELVNTLQDYASSKGLEDEDINLLASIIINIGFSATKMVSLIKCLIPRYKVPEQTFKTITTWYLSSVDELPITVSIMITQWIIVIYSFRLMGPSFNRYKNNKYILLCILLRDVKKRKIVQEKHIARLIYVLTKPEDVTRRDVCRLLTLRQKYSRPKAHITVLLSLFKSYKPELVPEQIQSVSIEGVWKPIPEILQVMFQNARARLEVQQAQNLDVNCFKWIKFEHKTRKNTMTPLLPSVGYFQIGSSIFKEKDTTSIFDISSTEELGKSHLNIELPCNAISLLTSTAGYHLLTFADFQYQSRFSYNLYNTLVRAFTLESEKFSMEEINKLLDMTIEFSRYMQQGIPAVYRFLDEYLYFNTGEHQSKLLTLLQWMTSVPVNDLQERILVHIQNMFHESALTTKCEIIKTLKMLITNLYITQGFEECHQTTPPLFLGQTRINNLEDVIFSLMKLSEDLTVSGLNTHSYNNLLLAEALSFYEQIYTLEEQSNILSFTLAPKAVIYGGFVAKHCTILSRTCHLLLRYRNMALKLKDHKLSNLFRNQIYTISNYAKDISEALWFNESDESNAYFSQDVPEIMLKDLSNCGSDYFLNINNHYSILPYKCTLNKTGLNINTKESAMSVALYYYPYVNKFIDVFNT